MPGGDTASALAAGCPFDIILVIVFGALGYLMKKLGFDPGPLLLAFMLGALLEDNLRRSLLIFDGDATGFFTRPISGVLLVVFLLVALLPMVRGLVPRRRAGTPAPSSSKGARVTVLVGYAPAAEGDAAFDAGLAEARRRGEALVWVNTPRGGAAVSAELAPPDRVAALSSRAQDAGIELEVRQEPHQGDLADEIVRVAETVDASVIVIGLRRRTPVGKLLMGSTAQRILLDADRPVLAVKPRAS